VKEVEKVVRVEEPFMCVVNEGDLQYPKKES
jgi:hypothetical protein